MDGPLLVCCNFSMLGVIGALTAYMCHCIVYSSTGHQRSSPNKDFHEGTEAGKVGPIWNNYSDAPILEVPHVLLV